MSRWPITTTLVKFGQQERRHRGSSIASAYAVKLLRGIKFKELPPPLTIGTLPAFAWEVTDENTSASQTIKYPHWQHEFEAALVGGDPQSLRQRVDAAESALFLRLQALAESAEGDKERQAIAEAIATLRAIQREKLGYPEWNTK
jgi:hypothetical protein